MKYLIRGFDKKNEEFSSEFEIEISKDKLEDIMNVEIDYGCFELQAEHITKLLELSPDTDFKESEDYFIYF
ncbi:hypothetical protein GNP81_10285 [Aliivibrio fischeri]|uniref:DUF7683 domain-containing protein n=1 Tax=Aliivibrio fischeri TaxID=668 RepID=UPI0012D92FCA|nr:hypothetical protein [Aliivibrio fischeri]MUK63256.1 hypothetical protein [Aliivibrio fischeri]MUL20127.1 hypothetical protein [Aliivibrio fischeri]MUL24990.1 hypothetical protein [Aliivibrio fischeri]